MVLVHFKTVHAYHWYTDKHTGMDLKDFSESLQINLAERFHADDTRVFA